MLDLGEIYMKFCLDYFRNNPDNWAMSYSSIELYNALVEAGISKEKEILEANTILATKQDLNGVESSLLVELQKTKIDLIKWMIGLQVATATLIITILK